MKCPKCKYITFDYLDSCPRCGKDMAPEKAKFNISSIKPNPPFFLGSLTGDLNDSSVGINVPESAKESAEGMMVGDNEIYDDGSELDINIDEKDISESGEDAELDLGNLGLSDDDKELDLDFDSDNISPEIEEGAVEEEIKVEDSGSEESEIQESDKKKETEKDSEEIDLDMEDLELKLDFDEDEDSKE